MLLYLRIRIIFFYPIFKLFGERLTLKGNSCLLSQRLKIYNRENLITQEKSVKVEGRYMSDLKFELLAGLKLKEGRITHINEIKWNICGCMMLRIFE